MGLGKTMAISASIGSAAVVDDNIERAVTMRYGSSLSGVVWRQDYVGRTIRNWRNLGKSVMQRVQCKISGSGPS